MRKKPLVGAMTGVLALGVASVAIAGSNQGVTFDSTTTTKKPNASTGLNTHIQGAPVQDPAAGTFKAARTVIVQFPRGTKINSKAVPQCKLSAQQVQDSLGKDCPSRSKIGSGSAEAITGLGAGVDPVHENVAAYNRPNGLYFLLTPADPIGQTAVLTATWSNVRKAPKLTTVVPKFPLPGGSGEASLTKFDLKVKRSGKGRKAYSTTPRTCPKSKKWSLTATFMYDGGQTIKVKDTSPCKR